MTLRPLAAVALLMAATLVPASCRSVNRPQVQAGPPPADASLWVEPADLAGRDLYHGPWGAEMAPDPTATYTLVNRKHTGTNLGMAVLDDRGREWSVKQAYPGGLDAEGPAEVALSRLLSAIGYHQAPVYFLPAFRLKDGWGTHVEIGGRFRLKQESLNDSGSWRWEDSPFVGTTPYQGLIVLLMMFNSTDLKNSNNSVYEQHAGRVERWYAVRDIGAALGDTNLLSPRKNHVDSFERSPFILGVHDGHVQFAYKGLYKKLVENRISPDDVLWASELLGRLSPRQWDDAFRAGGYEPAVANRFIATLQKRIQQGRALVAR